MPPKPVNVHEHPLHEFAPEDVRTLVEPTRRGFGRSRAPRQVTRHAFYLEEDEDFDADKHPVSLAREVQLQRMDLQDGETTHVDAGAELGDGEGDMQRVGMPQESDAAIEQFRSDLHDRSLVRNIVNSKKRGSARAAKVVERTTVARTQAHNEALVRAKMRETSVPAFERLAAARAVAEAERDRLTRNLAASNPLSNDAPNEPTNIPVAATSNRRRVDPREQEREEYLRKQAADRRRAQEQYTPPAAQAVTVAELTKMLALNPYGELPVKLQLGLLELADMRSVVSLLQRLIYQDEFDKTHFNTLEIIESMVCAGAKFVEMSRVKLPARLATALDPRHYGAYIVKGSSGHANDVALVGGHEHYVDGATHLLLMEFRCVRRNRENNANEARKKATRALGTELSAQFNAEAEPINTDLRDYDGEDVDVYEDADDAYDGGNDIKNPERHFIYKVTLVFVEALDVTHKNETMTDCAHGKNNKSSESDSELDTSVEEQSESLDIFAKPKPAQQQAEARNQMDEFRYDGGAPEKGDNESDDSDSEQQVVPLGKMNVSPEKARTLVGKWRTNVLIGWLNGNQRPAPLCFRAYHISI